MTSLATHLESIITALARLSHFSGTINILIFTVFLDLFAIDLIIIISSALTVFTSRIACVIQSPICALAEIFQGILMDPIIIPVVDGFVGVINDIAGVFDASIPLPSLDLTCGRQELIGNGVSCDDTTVAVSSLCTNPKGFIDVSYYGIYRHGW